MKLSYLVTVKDEGERFLKLIKVLEDAKILEQDELVVLYDGELGKFSKTDTESILIQLRAIENPNLKVLCHPLNNDYGSHKNFGNQQCSGDYVFQIDGDERPTPALMENVKAIIEANPDVELFYVPRINDVRGVTEESARPWGWRLTPSAYCEGRMVIQWPDHQSRIYKRVPERIRWDRRLHEKIEGHTKYVMLPAEEDFALYHDKTIEIQLATNMRYNKIFSEAENKGHNVI